MKQYTADDARREVQEMLDEGYGMGAVNGFLNELRRGGDITRQEARDIWRELVVSDLDASVPTYGGD